MLAFLLLFLAPAVSAEVTFDDLVNSSDIVISEAAQSGAAVAVVAHPENFEGGVKLDPGQSLKIQDLVNAWKNGDRTVGLGILVKDFVQNPAPPAGIELVTNGEFSTDLSGWTAINAYGGATEFGPITAPVGSTDGKFAVAHTGPWKASNHGSISQQISVDANTQATLSIVYNFVTTEFPGSVGSTYNDNIIVTLADAQDNISFSLFEDVNSSSFTAVSGLPADKMYLSDGGQTGWITENSPLMFLGNGVYTLTIQVNDVTDYIVDSAILVDRVGLVSQ